MALHRYAIRGDGVNVHLLADGKSVLCASPELALELAKAITQKARQAIALRPAVMDAQAGDIALLLRRGVRLGLSDDPRVKEEALKRAVGDRELRRAIPSSDKIEQGLGGMGGLGSQAVVGVPMLVDLSNKRGVVAAGA